MPSPYAASPAFIADHALAGRASRLEDRQFALMQQAFEQTGGLCDSLRIERLMRRHWTQPLSQLARWIVDRRIVSFRHLGETWVPLFQFEPGSMQLDANAARVIDELVPAFDDWDLAGWFASPNEALQGASPVATIATDPDAVLDAARVDRFIALG